MSYIFNFGYVLCNKIILLFNGNNNRQHKNVKGLVECGSLCGERNSFNSLRNYYRKYIHENSTFYKKCLFETNNHNAYFIKYYMYI